jgi:Bacterial Ig-like domain (group 3)
MASTMTHHAAPNRSAVNQRSDTPESGMKRNRGHLWAPIGLCVLVFAFLPGAASSGASVPQLVTPTTVSIVANPAAIVEGQSFQVQATVSGTSGTPTGTVQIRAADGEDICTVDLSGGTGSCTTVPFFDTPNPSDQITGFYSGDSTYSGATGSTTIDLSPAATVTALASTSYSPQSFSAVSLTATVSVSAPGTGPADGEPIVFTDNGVPIEHSGENPSCDGIDGSGDQSPYYVVCQINTISPGTHIYQAQYPGDNFYDASTSASITVSAAATPTRITGGSETQSPVPGQKIFLDGSVLTGGPTAQGDLTFSVGSLLLCSTIIDSGTAGCYTTAEPAGSDTVTMSFVDPSGMFAPSSSTFVLDVGGGLASAVGIAAMPSGGGYWIADAQGDVAGFGSAVNYGSLTGKTLNAPVTHIVSTPDGRGYWLVAADGGTFSFGDAGFYGSMGGKHLNAPVVDIAPTADGGGYWLVASDGGIFAFGDAHFYGSMGGTHLNRPVVGIDANNATGGYWEVATDGGIFAFNAPFYGSTGNIHLNEPVNGMANSSDGDGYLFVASDGGVFTYGDARFFGSMGGTKLAAPIVGIAPDWATGGYWLVGSDGGIFSFNAPFLGAR